VVVAVEQALWDNQVQRVQTQELEQVDVEQQTQ
jgi:hypothetical protein